MSHWRAGDSEVDLLLEVPGRPLAFEVASSASHHRRGLQALMRQHPEFCGGCYLVAPNAGFLASDKDDATVGTFPLDHFLRAVSGQADLAMHRRLGVNPL